jgi:hypothetical protein
VANLLGGFILVAVFGLIGILLIFAGTRFWHPLVAIGAVFIFLALFIGFY